ncbi:MAG: hypothetical protein Q7J27_08155 [Syntrophales bacterium]|nr:hypothetical protein [Syntrophales bacterium]
MNPLTLPFCLWWVTLTVMVIFFGLSLSAVESGGMEHMRKQTAPEVKAAILRCGPMKYCRTLWTGELQVNKVSGLDDAEGWERLQPCRWRIASSLGQRPTK